MPSCMTKKVGFMKMGSELRSRSLANKQVIELSKVREWSMWVFHDLRTYYVLLFTRKGLRKKSFIEMTGQLLMCGAPNL